MRNRELGGHEFADLMSGGDRPLEGIQMRGFARENAGRVSNVMQESPVAGGLQALRAEEFFTQGPALTKTGEIDGIPMNPLVEDLVRVLTIEGLDNRIEKVRETVRGCLLEMLKMILGLTGSLSRGEVLQALEYGASKIAQQGMAMTNTALSGYVSEQKPKDKVEGGRIRKQRFSELASSFFGFEGVGAFIAGEFTSVVQALNERVGTNFDLRLSFADLPDDGLFVEKGGVGLSIKKGEGVLNCSLSIGQNTVLFDLRSFSEAASGKPPLWVSGMSVSGVNQKGNLVIPYPLVVWGGDPEKKLNTNNFGESEVSLALPKNLRYGSGKFDGEFSAFLGSKRAIGLDHGRLSDLFVLDSDSIMVANPKNPYGDKTVSRMMALLGIQAKSLRELFKILKLCASACGNSPSRFDFSSLIHVSSGGSGEGSIALPKNEGAASINFEL